ncbi:hypothetical protein [Nisaea sp.]|uniref:hypothetical protein n=3 Tax=Alphaproteobacteria TaxID=28211 RepID=UPI00329850A5
MNDMNPRAVVGGNNPPDPIDEINASFEADREEAANWTDGAPVENEAQMKAVDALRKSMREWRLSLEKGQKAATAPLRAVYQAELDRWKPTIEDAKRIEGCLVSTVDAFKRKLKAEKEAAERAAWEAANKARREAEEKARAADASNLEAQREAQAAKEAAMEAEKAAQAAKKDQVKGLRTVTRYTIDSHKTALADIYKTDPESIVAFVDEYVRRNHKTRAIAGVTVTQEQEAY